MTQAITKMEYKHTKNKQTKNFCSLQVSKDHTGR